MRMSYVRKLCNCLLSNVETLGDVVKGSFLLTSPSLTLSCLLGSFDEFLQHVCVSRLAASTRFSNARCSVRARLQEPRLPFSLLKLGFGLVAKRWPGSLEPPATAFSSAPQVPAARSSATAVVSQEFFFEKIQPCGNYTFLL